MKTILLTIFVTSLLFSLPIKAEPTKGTLQSTKQYANNKSEVSNVEH